MPGLKEHLKDLVPWSPKIGVEGDVSGEVFYPESWHIFSVDFC